MSLRWSISVGQLFDVLLPAAVAGAILCSTFVLADAQRRGLKRYAVAAWTLGTLILPFTCLPLYLLARFWRSGPTTLAARPLWSRAVLLLPLVYATALLALAALYFWHDYRSLDAHLARASGAKLHEQHARAADEYRAALRLADDPHTRKLLGLELAAAQQWPAALAELRAAERAGEQDDALAYHIANALDTLDRRAEAHAEYSKFLAGNLCVQSAANLRCQHARVRMAQLSEPAPAK
ncbi:MAG TPA: hypothetical protein VF525_05735 [Pyrinomonadaceae bacterium]|jgi:hypothetical protein